MYIYNSLCLLISMCFKVHVVHTKIPSTIYFDHFFLLYTFAFFSGFLSLFLYFRFISYVFSASILIVSAYWLQKKNLTAIVASIVCAMFVYPIFFCWTRIMFSGCFFPLYNCLYVWLFLSLTKKTFPMSNFSFFLPSWKCHFVNNFTLCHKIIATCQQLKR